MKIIDLSLPIDDTLVETHGAKIERITHKAGVEHFNWVVMSKQPNGQARFDKDPARFAAKSSGIPDGPAPQAAPSSNTPPERAPEPAMRTPANPLQGRAGMISTSSVQLSSSIQSA